MAAPYFYFYFGAKIINLSPKQNKESLVEGNCIMLYYINILSNRIILEYKVFAFFVVDFCQRIFFFFPHKHEFSSVRMHSKKHTNYRILVIFFAFCVKKDAYKLQHLCFSHTFFFFLNMCFKIRSDWR